MTKTKVHWGKHIAHTLTGALHVCLVTRVPTKQEKWFFSSSPHRKWVFLLTWTERLFIFKQYGLLWLDEIQFSSPFFSFMTVLLMEGRKMNVKQSERVVCLWSDGRHFNVCPSEQITSHLVLAFFYDDLGNSDRVWVAKGFHRICMTKGFEIPFELTVDLIRVIVRIVSEKTESISWHRFHCKESVILFFFLQNYVRMTLKTNLAHKLRKNINTRCF